MKKLVAILLTILASSQLAIAKVDTQSVPTTAVEESAITIKGVKINSASNPFTVSVLTADGASITLPTNVINAKKAQIYLPSIPDSASGLVQLTLRISGGDVSSSSPDSFLLLLAKRTANTPNTLPGNIASSLPELPANVTDGLGVAGPQGPQGEQGEQGNQGPAGPSGPAGIVPTNIPAANIIGTVATSAIVINSIQDNIRTLPNLVNGGTTGITTNFFGPVNGAEGFTGNLTGDVTGNVTGNLTGDVTGNVTGDLTGQVLTPSQSSITTLAGLTNAGTTLVNTTFAGPVVGNEGFVGNLTGNVTGSITGNVTGNVSGSSATFTGALSGDVGGTQSATTIADSVVLGKVLAGGYAADNGTVAAGDSITTAIKKLDGNRIDNSAKIEINRVAIGAPTASNTPSEIVKRDASGNFAAGVITATSFVGNLSGSVSGLVTQAVQPSIVNMAGLTSIGATTVPTTVKGPLIANEGISGTFTGNVNGNLNGQVLVPRQTSIKTLPALVNGGTAGVTTTFFGPVAGNQGFVGNLTGNVTGNADTATYATTAGSAGSFSGTLDGDVNGGQLSTQIKPGVVANKKILGVYTAGAGVVANGDTLKEAIQKLDGNVGVNTLAIAANTAALAAATDANTASTIVKRDASGNFSAGTITATSFVGAVAGASVTGTVANATNAVNATNATTATKANAVAGTAGTGTLTYNDTASNYNTVLRATAATDVTLPTSGTLATTTGLTPMAVDASVAGAAIDVTTAGSAVSVAGTNFIKITDSGCSAGSISTLTGGVIGQKVAIMSFGCGPQILTHIPDGTPDVVSLQGNADLTTLGAGDTVEVIFDGTSWLELSRSNN